MKLPILKLVSAAKVILVKELSTFFAILLLIFMGNTVMAQGNSACIRAPDGLLAWWPGDGDANDIAGGRNGTINNVQFIPGEVGQAFSFNANSSITIPDDPIWTLATKAFTIDLWVNFNQVNSPIQAFIAHDDGPTSSNKWIFYWGLGPPGKPEAGLRFHINNHFGIGLVPVYFPWNPVPGQWYHVAITRQDQNYSLYIDGNQVVTQTDSTSIPDPAAPLTIGYAEPQYAFDGLIDEVQIYNRALSAAEIQAIFSASSAGICKEKRIPVIIIPGVLGSYLDKKISDTNFKRIWLDSCNAIKSDDDSFLSMIAFDKNAIPSTSDIVPNGIFFGKLASEEEDCLKQYAIDWCNYKYGLCGPLPLDKCTLFTLACDYNQIEPGYSGKRLIEFAGENLNSYKDLIDYLGKNGYQPEDVITFAYDWRKDITENGKLLKSFIEDSTNGVLVRRNSSKVDIVAHSMGGLVTRSYLALYGGESTVRTAIYLGTPHRGAPKMFCEIAKNTNPEYYVTVSRYVNSKMLRDLSLNYPSAYQVLPSYKFVDHYVKNINGMSGLCQTPTPLFQPLQPELKDVYKASGENGLLEIDDLSKYYYSFEVVADAKLTVNEYNLVVKNLDTPTKLVWNTYQFQDGANCRETNDFHFDLGNGDGTVPYESATGISGPNVQNVDPFDKIEHSNLPNNDKVDDKILEILTGASGTPNPSPTPSLESSTIAWYSESLINVNIVDENGNRCGVNSNGSIIDEIDGGYYIAFPENQFGYLPTTHKYDITIEGNGSGSFGLKFVRPLGNGQASLLSEWRMIPVFQESLGNITLEEGTLSDLSLDINGDGKVIESIPPTFSRLKFIRGDANSDGKVDISDAIYILYYLFMDNGENYNSACKLSLDIDDNGSLEITDAIYLLGFLFLNGRPIPAPFSDCGFDDTNDDLSCFNFPHCH